MMEADRDKELFCDYIGQAAWLITSSLAQLGGADAPLPQYIELMHPETKKPEVTTEQVKAKLLERLAE